MTTSKIEPLETANKLIISGYIPLLVVVGETASGKSELAMQLAEALNGEIICADSRTIYRHMDIGTAKPTPQDRQRVIHYGLDLITPDQRYSAATYKAYALNAIDSVAESGKLPIIVGGSGLYIDAVLYDYGFTEPSDESLRESLQTLSIVELQQRIIVDKIPMPSNFKNPRHLISAIERAGKPMTRSLVRSNTIVLGLQIERSALQARVEQRVKYMIGNGFLTEAEQLADKYGWDAPGMQSTSYKAFRGYFAGTDTLEQAKQIFIQNDIQLAKKQRTWFKRNKSIHWLSTDDKLSEAVEIATTLLNK